MTVSEQEMDVSQQKEEIDDVVRQYAAERYWVGCSITAKISAVPTTSVLLLTWNQKLEKFENFISQK